jgi:hypothetical protein
MRNEYGIVVEKPQGKRSIERPGLRWRDNIKIYIHEG